MLFGIDPDESAARGRTVYRDFAASPELNASVDGAIDAALASYVPIPAGSPDSIPAFGLTAYSRTEKYRAKLAATRAGAAFTKLLCIGDSTTYGTGAAPATTSYPALLAVLLDAEFVASRPGFIAPPFSGGTTGNAKWSAGSWVGSGATVGLADSAAWWASAATASPLTFTPGFQCDTFDIYYVRNVGFGTVTPSVNGVAQTPFSTAGTVGVFKQTVTFTAHANPVLSLVNDGVGSPGQAFVLGVEAYLSTAKTIRVGNGGVSNSTSDKWRQSAATFRSLETLKAYAPDLTIFMIGINDSGGSWSASTFNGYVTTTVQAAQLSGDVILMSPVPSAPFALSGKRPEYEAIYAAEMAKIAKKLGCVFIDLFDRWGDYASAAAKGYMSDYVHPNAAGNADIARAVADALELI